MKAVISNSLLLKIKPTGKQYDIRDSKLTGFIIRVTSSGKMNYVCEYKRGRRINLGNVEVLTSAQARDKAKEILGDAAKGISCQTYVKKFNKWSLWNHLLRMNIDHGYFHTERLQQIASQELSAVFVNHMAIKSLMKLPLF